VRRRANESVTGGLQPLQEGWKIVALELLEADGRASTGPPLEGLKEGPKEGAFFG